MDMDDFISRFIEDVSIDALAIWADILDVEFELPPLDDMYPDWEDLLRVEVAETLVNALSKISKKG